MKPHLFSFLVIPAAMLAFSNAQADQDTDMLELEQPSIQIMQCYWMENYSGDYNWIAPGIYSKKRCFELDSCDGGLGASGGGCYKWASSENAEREPWIFNKEDN